jgi:hypothetical protein
MVLICYTYQAKIHTYANGRKTKERFTRTIRKIHETNARYTNEIYENASERTHDTRNERTIHERTNHWSVTIYYPMTNDPDLWLVVNTNNYINIKSYLEVKYMRLKFNHKYNY